MRERQVMSDPRFSRARGKIDAAQGKNCAGCGDLRDQALAGTRPYRHSNT
jgi:hypothetical protein